MVRRLEYPYWKRHPAVPLMAVGVAFAATVTAVLAAEAREGTGGGALLLFTVFAAPPVILNGMIEVLNKRRFGTILLSHDGVGIDRSGVETWLHFSEIERVEAIRPGSADFIMAGRQGGVRIAAATKSFLVYESVQGYSQLRETLEEGLAQRCVPMSWR